MAGTYSLETVGEGRRAADRAVCEGCLRGLSTSDAERAVCEVCLRGVLPGSGGVLPGSGGAISECGRHKATFWEDISAGHRAVLGGDEALT